MQPLLGVIIWNMSMHKQPCKAACTQPCETQCRPTQPGNTTTGSSHSHGPHRTAPGKPRTEAHLFTKRSQRQPQPWAPLHRTRKTQDCSPLLYQAKPAPAPAPASELGTRKPLLLERKVLYLYLYLYIYIYHYHFFLF